MTQHYAKARPMVDGLSAYMRKIERFPILEKAEEQRLAHVWKDKQDMKAVHTLVNSHLRLVCKMARSFEGYGMPILDLISEGNIGLIQAVKRFDPSLGFRLSTYAMWWVRAAMTEYVLSSWSIVKSGTVAARKKLFFGLRSLKNKLNIPDRIELSPQQVNEISKIMKVSPSEVIDMNRRLSGGDLSLNRQVGDEEGVEFIDLLSDEDDMESHYIDSSVQKYRSALLQNALEALPKREREILVSRRLHDQVKTLENLAKSYGISRERVRQIESNAMRKVRKSILASHRIRNFNASFLASTSG